MDSYKYESMDKILAIWENQKKDKHGKKCHEKQKKFPPFVLSIDGMIGKEALVVLENVS